MVTPVLRFAPDVLLAAQNVRVVFFDADVIVTGDGVHFNVLDGHGLRLLRQAGITPVVIAERDSASLGQRLTTLGIDHVHWGAENKLRVAEQLLATLGFDWTHAAAIGHDWPDLPVLTRCAFAVASANAHAEVGAMAHYVTSARGGDGAARELCDLLLTAAGRYAGALTAAVRGPGA